MTSGELIERLRVVPADTPVMVSEHLVNAVYSDQVSGVTVVIIDYGSEDHILGP